MEGVIYSQIIRSGKVVHAINLNTKEAEETKPFQVQ